MKKAVNVFEEKAESLESCKKITKNVSENIHKVDGIVSSARSSCSIFSSQAIIARTRLREACERAVMTGPSSLKQRMEEIMWRKVFYDPLSAAKKLREGISWSPIESGLVWAHLNDGIAYYHQLLMSFAYCHKLEEFAADLLPIYYYQDDEQTNQSNCSESFLKESFFRILTCLGDLARYMLDIPIQISENTAYLLSVRYYHQALHYNCEGGLTHSNLATVYSSNDQPLLAVVHYLRAITCEKPFEAAENNLKRMLDRSRIWLENHKLESECKKVDNLEKESQQFLHTCLALISCFINNRRTEEVAGLCQDVLILLGKLLDDYDNSEPPDISESSNDGVVDGKINGHNGVGKLPAKLAQTGSNDNIDCDRTTKNEMESTFLLNPESMVILSALFIVCVKRLKALGSPHANISEVLLVSMLLTLVSHINTRLEQRFALVDPSFIQKLLPATEHIDKVDENDKDQEVSETICNGISGTNKKVKKGKTSKLAKLRRKKKGNIEDDVDSEAGSGNEFEEDSSENNSLSDSEDDFDSSILCSSEDEEESDEDVKIESEQDEWWDGLTAEEHLQLIEQEGMLAAVYVTLDWLCRNEDMIKLCAKTAHNLWTSLAKLFNLLKIDLDNLKTEENSSLRTDLIKKIKSYEIRTKSKLIEFSQEYIPLPENMMLHLVLPYLHVADTSRNISTSEQTLGRLSKLYAMINILANKEETPILLEESKYVVSKDTILNAENAKAENDKIYDGRSTPSKLNATTESRLEDSPSHNKSSHASVSRVTSSMQSLTAQWLQHEVRNLEERTSRKVKLGGLYLVPDAAVLIHHFGTIKKLLASPSHMVIIPQVVIDSLDLQKRESVGAREAIRWLEVKFRHGSRFIRAQRLHERTRLPLIKYPKRKDKEAWEWFHLAECCYYLGAQMFNKAKLKTSTVTLLTGECPNKLSKLSFSPNTLLEAAGAVLMSVEEFTRKWQISTIGHS